jgi:signal transduction histidine kinase
MLDHKEKEYIALSRRLHDEIGAELASLKLMLVSLARNLHGADFEWTLRMNQVIDNVTVIARDLSADIYPVSLRKEGLDTALMELFERKNNPKIHAVKFISKGARKRLPFDHETVIYSAVKELVNNSIRHSCAWHIEVESNWSDRELIVSVKDDGLGPTNFKKNSKGLGHKLMRGSLEMIDASIKVNSTPKKFNTVIKYPIANEN